MFGSVIGLIICVCNCILWVWIYYWLLE